MNDAFRLDVPHTRGARAVIAPCGELDVSTAPDLRARALQLIAEGRPDLVADLSGVTFCDSSGLNALIGIWRCAREAGGSLALAAIPDRLGRLLRTTGMDTVLAAHPTADAALAALAAHRMGHTTNA
jgi:anti-sigma B factor antagonist